MVRWNKNVLIEGIAFKIKRSKPKSVSVTEDRHLTVECVYNVSCVLWNVDQGNEGLCSLFKKHLSELLEKLQVVLQQYKTALGPEASVHLHIEEEEDQSALSSPDSSEDEEDITI